jgi:CRISPR-associated endonuclease/helicase Cas3
MYMAQFLLEALRWLADSSVPVILLSATLPPAFRADLVRAYLQGALRHRDVNLGELPESEGYPAALAVSVEGDRPWFGTRASQAWRPPMDVLVEILDEAPDDDGSQVARRVAEALSSGGCALIIRNTVARAQQTFRRLKELLGPDMILLHARLTAATRAERTAAALDALGPPKGGLTTPRPHRLVVVATQLAEQSFDVDVDLLVTDLAPLDLLLQRVGRLHRHQRQDEERPDEVRKPRVIVTGIKRCDDAPPLFPRGSSYVYGDYLLLRAAALVEAAAANGGWKIPTDVPLLVAMAYSDSAVVAPSWEVAAETARQEWDHALQDRRARAKEFLLAGEDRLGLATLAGLHDRSIADLDDEDAVAAVVRDGEPTVEVVLVRRDDRGYATLGGRPMGPLGEGISDASVVEEVVGSTVRLPARPALTRAALDLAPLPGWSGDAWLRRMRALVLDETRSARLGGRVLTYDEELGLLDERST